MNYYDWQLVKDHYYLGTRNGGPSKTLTNNVVVIHILLNDLISNWMFPMHVSEYQTASSLMALNLTLNAKIHNAPLAVQNTYCQATLPLVIDATGSWVPLLFNSLGFASAEAMQRKYEAEFNCEEAPIIIAVNRPMRSYAMMNNARSVFRANDEWSVVFRQNYGTFDMNVLTHELLHQFGAVDYYYPDVTIQAAQRYFPQSVMLSGTEIDDLTRYLIGWTSDLSDAAISFLKETSSVNDLTIALAKARGV